MHAFHPCRPCMHAMIAFHPCNPSMQSIHAIYACIPSMQFSHAIHPCNSSVVVSLREGTRQPIDTDHGCHYHKSLPPLMNSDHHELPITKWKRTYWRWRVCRCGGGDGWYFLGRGCGVRDGSGCAHVVIW